ncbi:PAS domain-containing protein [Lentzea sp. HUAS12]|uniref:PAS domain-containing protein n=1 Tax=Lentzea sp. HUAS12 TaxID=2951806 RepID=UPI00209D5378|nr:PAS domain-containing protein [Lentzea sp. HUAS12]USX56371.1 PAS domain-containing protein [Lentzea sp. HUAS12]
MGLVDDITAAGVHTGILDAVEERYLGVLMENPSIHAAVVDEGGGYIWANPTALAFYGASLEQVRGKTPADLGIDVLFMAPGGVSVGPGEPGPIPQDLQQRHRFRLRTDSVKGRHWFDGVVFALPRQGWRGTVALDVTAQVEAERASREAEERFSAFMLNLPTAATIKDGAGRHLWANPAYLHAYGLLAADVVGRQIADLVEPEVAAEVDRLDRAVRVDGTPRRDICTLPRGGDPKSGTAIAHRFPLRSAAGEQAFGTVLVDISTERQARREAEAAQEQYRELFHHAGVPIALLDIDGVLLDANCAYLKLHGQDLSEMRGRSIREITRGVVEAAGEDHWQTLTSGRLASYRRTAMLKHANGALIIALCTLTLVRGHDGAAKYVYVIADPLTDISAGGLRPHLEEDGLSTEEATILVTLAAGETLGDAGEALHLSRAGLNHHLSRLRRRLGLPARTRTAGLVARAYTLGLLELGTWPPKVAVAVTAGRTSGRITDSSEPQAL